MSADKRLQADLLLHALFGNQNVVEQWWRGPNKAFDDKTPNEMWIEDRARVMNYLLAQVYQGGGT